MDEHTQASREEYLPGEVVECYIQPDPREVVERYSRPLPGRRAVPPQPRRRSRRGLWVFSAVPGGDSWVPPLALCCGTTAREKARDDRFVLTIMMERDSSAAMEEITIPTYPTGQGVELTVETRPVGGS